MNEKKFIKNMIEKIKDLNKEIEINGVDIREDSIISYLSLEVKEYDSYSNKLLGEILDIIENEIEIYNNEIRIEYGDGVKIKFIFYLDSFYWR